MAFIFPHIGSNIPNWLSYFSEEMKPPTSNNHHNNSTYNDNNNNHDKIPYLPVGILHPCWDYN